MCVSGPRPFSARCRSNQHELTCGVCTARSTTGAKPGGKTKPSDGTFDMRRRPVPALKNAIAILKEAVAEKDQEKCEAAFEALTKSECLVTRTSRTTEVSHRDCP